MTTSNALKTVATTQNGPKLYVLFAKTDLAGPSTSPVSLGSVQFTRTWRSLFVTWNMSGQVIRGGRLAEDTEHKQQG